MENKLTHKIAKNQFNWTLDCVIGRQDPDYGFETEKWEFEQNFEEELEELGVCSCQKRTACIGGCADLIQNFQVLLMFKFKTNAKR